MTGRLWGIALAAASLSTAAAEAAVDVIQVPAACGTMVEVRELLRVNMPNPEAIGTGGDGQGRDLVTLFAGDGYWALTAAMAEGRVCVVASGRNWKAGGKEAF
jgi:hypothetical protein